MASVHRNGNGNGGILYNRLSSCYDFLFRWITYPRQKAMLNSIPIRPGARVMDLGVGTGISLPLYPRHCRVTGVDISPKMLARARRRAARKKLTHVELVEMDAHGLDEAFPQNTFDIIIAAFVLTVTEDPVRVLKNMKRIGKPDCTLFILNHSKSLNPLVRKCEKILQPLCKRIGWRTGVDLEQLILEAGLHVVSKRPCFRHDPYFVVQARNGKS